MSMSNLAWPHPLLCKALSIRDDEHLHEKGLVLFVGLTGTVTPIMVELI